MYIYLNNNESKREFPENTNTHFTNQLTPPLYLGNSQDYEIGLCSLLMPFEAYKSKFGTNEMFLLQWKITVQTEDNNVEVHVIDAGMYFTVVNSLATPTDILKRFIDNSEEYSSFKSALFNNILNIYGDKLIITQIRRKSVSQNGPYRNLIRIEMIINDESKRLFGLHHNFYLILDIDPDLDQPTRNIVSGAHVIGLSLTPPKYIIIYSDVVTTSNYGPQNLSVLDVLPFDRHYSCERKIGSIKYKNISKNIINDISVAIKDSAHQAFENFTEDVIVALHIRKKQSINTQAS